MKFEDNSKECKAAIRKALEKGIVASTQVIQSQAKAFAPVDTGRLRKSISTKNDLPRLTGIIGTNVEYAIFQEFGTIHQSGTPYMRPAFRTKRQEVEKLFEKYLREVVGK